MWHYTSHVVFGGILIGAGSTLWGMFYTSDDPLSHAGSVSVVLGTILVLSAVNRRAIARVNRPADVAYDEGYEMGYDRGFTEGRRTIPPTLISLPRRAAASGDS